MKNNKVTEALQVRNKNNLDIKQKQEKNQKKPQNPTHC